MTLLPPGPNSRPQQVVLVLSSSVPANWTINAPGVRGHVSVHVRASCLCSVDSRLAGGDVGFRSVSLQASDTVTPPYPPEPDLALSSSRLSDLSTGPDVLAWTRRSGFPRVASYTEVELANRVVIQLAGGGTGPMTERVPAGSTDALAAPNPPREALTVQCEDGRISAAVASQVHMFYSLLLILLHPGLTPVLVPGCVGPGGCRDVARPDVPGPVQRQPFPAAVSGGFLRNRSSAAVTARRGPVPKHGEGTR